MGKVHDLRVRRAQRLTKPVIIGASVTNNTVRRFEALPTFAKRAQERGHGVAVAELSRGSVKTARKVARNVRQSEVFAEALEISN